MIVMGYPVKEEHRSSGKTAEEVIQPYAVTAISGIDPVISLYEKLYC